MYATDLIWPDPILTLVTQPYVTINKTHKDTLANHFIGLCRPLKAYDGYVDV